MDSGAAPQAPNHRNRARRPEKAGQGFMARNTSTPALLFYTNYATYKLSSYFSNLLNGVRTTGGSSQLDSTPFPAGLHTVAATAQPCPHEGTSHTACHAGLAPPHGPPAAPISSQPAPPTSPGSAAGKEKPTFSLVSPAHPQVTAYHHTHTDPVCRPSQSPSLELISRNTLSLGRADLQRALPVTSPRSVRGRLWRRWTH